MVKQRVLDTLIELSEKRRDEAATQVAEDKRATDRMQAMKAQLQEYRADYDRKAPTRVAQRTDVRQIEQHIRFVARLDVAIEDQSRRLVLAQRVQQRHEAELIEQQKRLKAFETLKLRRQQALRQKQERHEQRLTDEQAARIHYRRTTP